MQNTEKIESKFHIDRIRVPGGFDSGSVKGLKARGGFVVDIAWHGTGGFKEATVTCTHDTPGFRVRIKNGEVRDYLPAGGYKVYYKGEPAVDWLSGDVNGDGEINIGDVSKIIDVILGYDNDPDIFAKSDVNGDGEVNIGDVSRVIDIILGI